MYKVRRIQRRGRIYRARPKKLTKIKLISGIGQIVDIGGMSFHVSRHVTTIPGFDLDAIMLANDSDRAVEELCGVEEQSEAP